MKSVILDAKPVGIVHKIANNVPWDTLDKLNNLVLANKDTMITMDHLKIVKNAPKCAKLGNYFEFFKIFLLFKKYNEFYSENSEICIECDEGLNRVKSLFS